MAVARVQPGHLDFRKRPRTGPSYAEDGGGGRVLSTKCSSTLLQSQMQTGAGRVGSLAPFSVFPPPLPLDPPPRSLLPPPPAPGVAPPPAFLQPAAALPGWGAGSRCRELASCLRAFVPAGGGGGAKASLAEEGPASPSFPRGTVVGAPHPQLGFPCPGGEVGARPSPSRFCSFGGGEPGYCILGGGA